MTGTTSVPLSRVGRRARLLLAALAAAAPVIVSAGPCEDTLFWDADSTPFPMTQWSAIFTQTVDITHTGTPLRFLADRLRFVDDAPYGSIWAFELDVPSGASGFQVDYNVQGTSIEDSAVFLFWEDGTGTLHNIDCDDFLRGNSPGWYSAAEFALVPYACPVVDSSNFAWNTSAPPPGGVTVVKLHLMVFVVGIPTNDTIDAFHLGLTGGECDAVAGVGATSMYGVVVLALAMLLVFAILARRRFSATV